MHITPIRVSLRSFVAAGLVCAVLAAFALTAHHAWAADTVPPTPLTPEEQKLAAVIDTRLAKIATNDLFNGAVLIAHDGNVILRQGYGLANRELDVPHTPETKFRIGTLTSLFTALATLQLVQAGKLAPDESICDFVEECPEVWEPITIHHLLTRTSGLRQFKALPEYTVLKKAGTPADRLVDLYRELPLLGTPGKAWNYSEFNDILLGMAIEQASGQAYDAYLRTAIIDPLELSGTGLDSASRLLSRRAAGYSSKVTAAGYVDIDMLGAAGAMYSTVDDLHRVVQAMLAGETVSGELVTEMLETQIEDVSLYGGSAGYGYGWFRNEFQGHPRLVATGGIEGFMADVHLFPEDDYTVILLGNRQDQDTYPTAELIAGWILDGE
jgi:CubicO group peptidase (beta-lactamase class C family)